MAKQSSVNLDITNNADGFDISGGTVLRKLSITGGDITVAGSGSATLTFPTTTTTIAGIGITQSFTVLQTFNAGLSASGATFSGNIFAPNIVNSFNGITGAVQGVSAAVAGTGIAVSGATGSVTITNTGVRSFNGITGAVTGVASVNGSTGAVVTYVGTTGNIPYRYGTGVGITANSYFTLQSGDIGAPTDILILSGATNDTYGNTEAIGLEFHRAYSGLGLDEGGGAAIVAKGNYNDGAVDNGSSLWLVTPSVGGIIRLAPQGSEVVQVSAGNMNVLGSLSTTSTATIASTLTVQAGGAVLEWDGFAPTPTVLSILNTDISQNTLTLNAQGTFSSLNTNGTLQYGAAGAYSDAFSITTAITGATTVASFTKTAYRSFEFDVQGSRGTTGPYQFTKILAVHDGTTVTTTQLSNISTGGTAGTYTVDISGTLVRLRVTPGATASTVFKTAVKAIPV